MYVPTVYACLSCGEPLPPYRGGHCDACVEWTTFGPPVPPSGDEPGEPQPAPPIGTPQPTRCPVCDNSGATCYACGAIELSALGRRLRYEMKHDRPALLKRLRGTPRQFWKIHAHAYVLEIGGTTDSYVQPSVDGVVRLWEMLEAA